MAILFVCCVAFGVLLLRGVRSRCGGWRGGSLRGPGAHEQLPMVIARLLLLAPAIH